MLAAKLLSVGSSPILSTYISTGVSVNNASTYTFTNQNVGTAFSGRVLIIGVQSYTSASGIIINQITASGVSCTKIADLPLSSDFVTLWAVALDSGTTSTIVISCSGSYDACGIGIWSLENAGGFSTEAIYNTAFTTPAFTATFANVNNGNVIISYSRIRSANVGTYSITGATENFEQIIESGVTGHLGGSTNIVSAGSNYTVSYSSTGSSPYNYYLTARLYK